MRLAKLLLFCLIGLTTSLALRAHSSSAWRSTLAEAQTAAHAENKLILVHFSGSDWCGWCMKLRKDVFQKPEFLQYASNNLVLLAVDFPKRKNQPVSTQQANQELARRFQVEGFPTLLVLDASGRRIGVLGFADGGSKAFIRELEKLVEQQRRAEQAAAAQSSGNKTIAVSKPIPRGGLHLQGISARKGRLEAQINNRTLTAGQTAKVRVASGEVAVRCLEIRSASVLVKTDGRKEPLELKLVQNL